MMKIILITGIILFAGAIIFGASRPNSGLTSSQTQTNAKIVSGSILTGLALIVISGIMYLKS